MASRRVAAGARTAQLPFQVKPTAQAFTFLAAGFGSSPGSASSDLPNLDEKVADTPVPPFTNATHRLGIQDWEVQDGWGARARHQQHAGCGYSGSCSLSRAVHRPQLTQHGASQEDALTERLQNPVQHAMGTGYLMRNLKVPLTKHLLLKNPRKFRR